MMPRCPICGDPTLGVCCDVLMHDLDDDGGRKAMNAFDKAIAAHVGESSALGVSDGCFAAGWIAALDAVLRSSGNLPSCGGVTGKLRAQATAYVDDDTDGASG